VGVSWEHVENGEKTENDSGNPGVAEAWSDDLGVVSEIDAFVKAVEADVADDLMDDDELDDLELPAVDPGDSIAGAVELDDEDFEELEAEAEPLSLYLEIDGTLVEIDRDRFVIGRVSSLCDFALVDVNVSRQHCAIERRAAGYYLVDCGSINGVTIAGQRVDNHLLADGEVLELAGHTMRVRFAPRGALSVAGTIDADAGADVEPEPGPPTELELRTTAPHDAVSPANPVSQATVEQPGPTAYGEATGWPAQSFEERVEQRLAELSQKLDGLQQSMQWLLANFAQIQDAAAVAQAIRKRLGG
jgi:hypothetical protein